MTKVRLHTQISLLTYLCPFYLSEFGTYYISFFKVQIFRGKKPLLVWMTNPFFKRYRENVLLCLSPTGVGAVFVYDYIGSYQRVPMVCCGRAQKLMQPILDRISINPTQLKNKKKKCGSKPSGSDHGELDSPVLAGLSCEEAVSATKEAFLSGAEREISLGDGVEIVIVKKGVAKPIIEWMPLPIH